METAKSKSYNAKGLDCLPDSLESLSRYVNYAWLSKPSTIYPWTANIDKKVKVNKLNVTLYEREHFRNSFTVQSIWIILKNALNKSYLELNFPQKTSATHNSIFPQEWK